MISILTSLLWDFAAVSYHNRIQWLFLAVMGHLAVRRRNDVSGTSCSNVGGARRLQPAPLELEVADDTLSPSWK